MAKKNTEYVIEALKQEGQKKIHGHKKIHALAKALWNIAINDKDIDGEHPYSARDQLKAAEFITTMMEGKATEKRQHTLDIFHHYPELEDRVDDDKYKVVEIESRTV